MLQVQSFDIGDSFGINTLLSQYRLAAGAHILVSDGKVCIPYEDGEPKSNVLKIIDIKEQKNIIDAQVEIINHSQKVLEFLKKDAQARVDEAQANYDEVRTKSKTDKEPFTKKLNDAKAQLSELETQVLKNQAELLRLQINIEQFDKMIEELQA